MQQMIASHFRVANIVVVDHSSSKKYILSACNCTFYSAVRQIGSYSIYCVGELRKTVTHYTTQFQFLSIATKIHDIYAAQLIYPLLRKSILQPGQWQYQANSDSSVLTSAHLLIGHLVTVLTRIIHEITKSFRIPFVRSIFRSPCAGRSKYSLA